MSSCAVGADLWELRGLSQQAHRAIEFGPAFCLAKVVGTGTGERWWAWGVAIVAAVVPLAAVRVGFRRWDSLGSKTRKGVRRAGELLPFAGLAVFPVVAGLPDAWQMAYWSLPVGLFAWFFVYCLRLGPEASSH